MKKRLQKFEDGLVEGIKDLFESYGFDEYKMRMFEKYSLYLTHKDFLVSDKIITFTDIDGELLALRPDVTLSIVKNSLASKENCERLYYCENVFRVDKKNGRYREIKQLGLEHIGSVGTYEKAETIMLALQTLKQCSNEFVLELSHINFVSAHLKRFGLSTELAAMAKKAIGASSENELMAVASMASLCDEDARSLCKIIKCEGALGEVLGLIDELAVTDEMRVYSNELRELYDVIKSKEYIDKVRFDCSLMGEENYYNGIIFSGFIKGVPKIVLSGGQYDRLLEKFGRDVNAIGFAVYLGEIASYMASARDCVDVLIVYGNKSACEVMEEVDKHIKAGKSVRVCKCKPNDIVYKSVVDMEAIND